MSYYIEAGATKFNALQCHAMPWNAAQCYGFGFERLVWVAAKGYFALASFTTCSWYQHHCITLFMGQYRDYGGKATSCYFMNCATQL